MAFRHIVLSAYLWRCLPCVPSDWEPGGTVFNLLCDHRKAKAMVKRWPWLLDDAAISLLRSTPTGVLPSHP